MSVKPSQPQGQPQPGQQGQQQSILYQKFNDFV